MADAGTELKVLLPEKFNAASSNAVGSQVCELEDGWISTWRANCEPGRTNTLKEKTRDLNIYDSLYEYGSTCAYASVISYDFEAAVMMNPGGCMCWNNPVYFENSFLSPSLSW